MNVNKHVVSSVAAMKGEDDDETALLRTHLEEASEYIGHFSWCRRIEETYFGAGIGGVVAVFLFRILPASDNDEWLWVITGDLPPAYLVTDQADSPAGALRIYCELMEDWVRVVRDGKPLEDVFPVAAEPTAHNADMLAKRIELLRNEVIPAFG